MVLMGKKIWDLCAPFYNLFMRSDRGAYEYMYELISNTVKDKIVLEIGCGTGSLARYVSPYTKSMVATDYSKGMLEVASRGLNPDNLRFEFADAGLLPYPDASYDIVIIANALHIMPEPIKALSEVRRVLKTGGILIAPNFVNMSGGLKSNLWTSFLSLLGVSFEHKWSKDGYVSFIEENGWKIEYMEMVDTRILMLYLECKH